MSTADSQLLVSSAAFTEDFYRRVLPREPSPRELVAVGRVSVAVLAGVAFLIALDSDALVLDLVAYAWAGFGAAFGPVLVLSLYWPRMTRRGALAGVVVGGLTVVIWKPLDGGLFDLYEIVPGMLFATLAAMAASLTDPAPREALEREFQRVLGGMRQAAERANPEPEAGGR
jgi:sodium/proline symporter